LGELCHDLDIDNSNTLSLRELQEGFAKVPEFAAVLGALDIKKDDMVEIFNMMDAGGDGDVSYEEFVKEVWKMQTLDIPSMVISIRMQVTQIRSQLMDQLGTMANRMIKFEENDLAMIKKIADEQGAQEVQMMDSIAENHEMIEANKAKIAENHNSIVPQNGGAIVDGPFSAEILAKLESMDRRHEQALASVTASIQALASQTLQDEISNGLANLRPLCAPQSLQPLPAGVQATEKKDMFSLGSLAQEKEQEKELITFVPVIQAQPNTSWSKCGCPTLVVAAPPSRRAS